MAREGSPRVPFWVVVRYDWSDPLLIRWTEVEGNHGDGGAGSMRVEPGDRRGMNGVIAHVWRRTVDGYALTGSD